MNSTLLPSAKLAPQFHVPKEVPSTFYPSHLLLGQDRVVNSFKLMSKLSGQHFFLADFPGIDRVDFIEALCSQVDTPTDQFLVATKPAEETAVTFKWQPQRPPENVGTIAKQQSLFCYLQGQIKRNDLLGKL